MSAPGSPQVPQGYVEKPVRQVAVGDAAVMRKAHPCGSAEWSVTRVGADIGLRCLGCGRKVMLDRETFERGSRRLFGPAENPPRNPSPEGKSHTGNDRNKPL